jgi:hypothetical protein
MEQLEKVLTRLRQEPAQKTKVKRLFLDLYSDPTFDLNKIPSYFPNLRFLGSTDRDHSPARVPIGMDYIEHIAEQNSSTWTIHLLSSSVCKCLKALEFDASSISGEKLAEVLKNAPSLRHLTMYSCKVSFEILEQVHSYLPFLETLRLKDTIELLGPLPLIISSDSMLTLFEIEFRFLNEVSALTMVTQFIRRKYTMLEKLVLMEPHSTDILKGPPVWYDQGLYPLISDRGSQLKELCIDSNGLPAKVFRIIDDGHCNLKKMEFANPIQQTLTGSAQLHYIQSLTLVRITKVDFSVLKAARMLKYLSLSFVQMSGNRKKLSRIGLECLLGACSSNIERLELENARLDVEKSPGHFDSMKTLVLNSMYLPAGIHGNVSKKLPELQSLKIRNCDMSSKKIILRGVDLFSFEITDKKSNNKDILVRTLNDNRTRWWSTQSKNTYSSQDTSKVVEDDAPLHPEGRYISVYDKHSHPMIILECGSVKKISVF